MAGGVLDRDDIEAQWAALNVAFTKKVVRGTDEHFVFFLCDAELRGSRLVFVRKPGTHFDDGQCVSVIAYKVDLTFSTGRNIIARNEDIAEAPQVPLSIHFPTHAYLQRLLLLRLFGGCSCITETFPRPPLHAGKPDTRN